MLGLRTSIKINKDEPLQGAQLKKTKNLDERCPLIISMYNLCMNKKIIVTTLAILLTSILIYLKILTFNSPCGFKYGAMAKTVGKEWPCFCIGIPGGEITSYTETYTCTGLNLSQNKLTPLLNINKQYPTIQN